MKWVTTTQILDDLSSENEQVWNEFNSYFYPVIFNFARKTGFSDTDAEDITQQSLLRFLKAFREGKYIKDKGRLKSWLWGIAHNVMLDYRRHLPKERLVKGKTEETSFWDSLEDEHSQMTWNCEWRKMVLSKCLEQIASQVDPKVLRTFELYAFFGRPAEEVAQTLGITANAVYIAKTRVVAKLRELVNQFEQDF